jgi:dynein heavy chain
VNDLKAQLAEQEIELTKKNEEADKLIEIVGIETEKVSKEKAIADEEELKVSFKTVILGVAVVAKLIEHLITHPY